MSMLFQHLLFISFNLHYTKAHVQHHQYIITSMIFTVYIIISYKASKNVEVHYA